MSVVSPYRYSIYLAKQLGIQSSLRSSRFGLIPVLPGKKTMHSPSLAD